MNYIELFVYILNLILKPNRLSIASLLLPYLVSASTFLKNISLDSARPPNYDVKHNLKMIRITSWVKNRSS